MRKCYNNMLTLSLRGGGQNNTIVCLNEKNNNYGKEFKRLDSFYRSFLLH